MRRPPPTGPQTELIRERNKTAEIQKRAMAAMGDLQKVAVAARTDSSAARSELATIRAEMERSRERYAAMEGSDAALRTQAGELLREKARPQPPGHGGFSRLEVNGRAPSTSVRSEGAGGYARRRMSVSSLPQSSSSPFALCPPPYPDRSSTLHLN